MYLYPGAAALCILLEYPRLPFEGYNEAHNLCIKLSYLLMSFQGFSDAEPSLGKRRRACIECRKSKTVCEPADDGSYPCCRCRRLYLDCIECEDRRSQKRNASASPYDNPALGNGGSAIARQLVEVLAPEEAYDCSILDCERGVMRVLLEFNHEDTPLELLREWTHVAIRRKDFGIVGNAMTLAASNGYPVTSLESFLYPNSNPINASSQTKLPACASWINDTTNGPQLVLIKRVTNGETHFVTNQAFEKCVVARDSLQATWETTGRPSTELFLHPEDAPKVCALVEQLWRNLQPSDNAPKNNPDAVEKHCLRELSRPVRVWGSCPSPNYVLCTGRVQLVVTEQGSSQTSNLVLSFARSGNKASSLIKETSEV